ncbi:hypothetical protein DSM106972_095380 [Dulcicalothrix desertica PCC 7102]|uniref:histidine kinase n=1 Tax=Dulcicalothrix desertica PCC 7102 TaxID=232991 RepID=A0A433UJ15_9CYAN|nr:PAS domain-containing protein [Dulcicalothrix desertica]RUS93779.1 hypothetical protein DSM106972_095380 [Dulcicalothrix desertica PCC 7102]TWH62743.1 PAS domain S-box-containing protein [Dulcicalothrix desertica PCC 7102]
MDLKNLSVDAESLESIAQIIENSDLVFWVCTPDVNQYFYISPGYERVWGKTRASLMENPHSFLESVHADDLERVTSSTVGDTAYDIDVEYRIIRPDGEVRWVRDRTFPVKDKDGNIYRMVGIAEDITARKQA